MMPPYDPDDWETLKHMTPMERMAREQDARDRRDRAVIAQLLDSLTPDDARLELFTFEERRQWDLKHLRKRARPANNDHEADGA